MLLKRKKKSQTNIAQLTPEAKKALAFSKNEQKKLNEAVKGEQLTNYEKREVNKAMERTKASKLVTDSFKEKEKAESDLKYYTALDQVSKSKKEITQKYKQSKGNALFLFLLSAVLMYVGWGLLQPPYGDFGLHNKGDLWEQGCWLLGIGFLGLVLSFKMPVSKEAYSNALKELQNIENDIKYPSGIDKVGK